MDDRGAWVRAAGRSGPSSERARGRERRAGAGNSSPLDLDHHGMVEQSVEQRRGHDRITEHLAALGEAVVRSQYHRPALVARVDELEEEVAATWDGGEVADLVHDQQRGPAEIADALAQGAVVLCLGPRGHEVGQRREHDAASGLDRLDGERDRQMALAGAGWSEQMDDPGPVDEGQFGQR